MIPWSFAFRGDAKSETLELDIFDTIGESWWRDSVSAKSVRAALKENRGAKTIKVRINSRGGEVADGSAIYSLLVDHPARVEVMIDGVAASMASIIAMAADEVRMSEAAYLMIHNPWGFAMGDAEEMRNVAETLDKMRTNLAGIYVKRSGQSLAQVLEWMDAETWFTAEEAKEFGFADSVTRAQKGQSKKQAAAFAAFAMDRDRFVNVPPALLEQAVAALSSWRAVAELSTKTGGELVEDPKDEGTAPQPAQSPINDPPVEQAEPPKVESTMTFPKSILAVLKLGEDADEAAVLAAVTKLAASAHAGSEIEKLLGCSGAEAVGAVRGLKDTKTEHDKLRDDLEKLKAASARRDFEALIASGTKERKLTPVQVKFETDLFEKALADGEDGSRVVSELRGRLGVTAPRSSEVRQPALDGTDPSAPMQFNGKPFEAMAPKERKALKDSNPELYNALRDDADKRGAI